MKYNKEIKKYINNLLMNDKNIPAIVRYKYYKKIIKNIVIEEEIYNSDLCIICFDVLDDKYITLKCNHKFHTKCLINLLSNDDKCCLCRINISNAIPTKNKELLGFLASLKVNIDSVEYTLNNVIEQDDIKEYININYIGFIKIIKKFTKKTKYDISFMNDYLQTLNLYKYYLI